MVRLAQEDLCDYYAGTGPFRDAQVPEGATHATEWWASLAPASLLSKIARRVLNVTVTISNEERIHKVYANVQPPERTRLAPERVDRYAKAAFWLNASGLPPREVNVGVSQFSSMAAPSPAEYAEMMGPSAAAVGASEPVAVVADNVDEGLVVESSSDAAATGMTIPTTTYWKVESWFDAPVARHA